MDIERAVDDFLRQSMALFRQLQQEGQAISDGRLTALRTQLLILSIEATSVLHRRVLSKKLYDSERATCAHRRAIDDVIRADGTHTGFIYCLECHEVLKDPAT